MRVLSGSEVRRALPMREAIDAMREAFAQLARGEVDLPPRVAVRVDEGQDAVVLTMPGRCRDAMGVGAKIVSVFPRNASQGRPVVQAAVLLASAETGTPVGLVEGTTLTALRTGAASGLATSLLARPEADRVAVVGAGAQARTQVEAMCCVRRVASVTISSRTRARAERLAAEVAEWPGGPAEVRVTDSAAEAVRDAGIVCMATAASEPVVLAGHLAPGTHLNAVGSFTPTMREFDPHLLADAVLVVDQRAAAMAEAGEVVAALDARVIEPSSLRELGAVVLGSVPGRTEEAEITVFKSVGLAVQDLVAAAWAVRRAQELGLGTVVPL